MRPTRTSAPRKRNSSRTRRRPPTRKFVYERDKKLRDQGIVSQETLDADKSTLDQDVATIDLDIATIASKEAALHAGR